MGYFGGMKRPSITALFFLLSASFLAQTSAFNVSQTSTMVEYRESFQMVPLTALGYGDFGPAELAMGGFDGTAVTASAEIGYEGWDGDAPYFWEETEPMGQARMDFQAQTSWSSAFDGPAVWVFGGFDGANRMNDINIFSDNRWSQPNTSGTPPAPRCWHTMVRFKDPQEAADENEQLVEDHPVGRPNAATSSAGGEDDEEKKKENQQQKSQQRAELQYVRDDKEKLQ